MVQGVRLVTRHQKPRGVGQPGGIVEREAPLHLSKLALIDPKTRQADKGRIQAASRTAARCAFARRAAKRSTGEER